MSYTIRVASIADASYAATIRDWYIASSQERGTGIATRTVLYLIEKLSKGDAIIALDGPEIIGFCYVETFEGKKYVSNSGLIINKEYRGQGLASQIKERIFQLAREKYPASRIFGITTSDAVMKINSKLGYRPVSFQQLTRDDAFWKGCNSCPNVDILLRNDKRMCLCTGMLFDQLEELIPAKAKTENHEK